MKLLRKLKRFLKNFISSISLQYKLIIVNALTIFLPVIAISIYSATTYVGYINDQMMTSKLQALSQVSSSVDAYVNELSNLSRNFDVSTGLRNVLTSSYSPQNAGQDNQMAYQYLMDIMSTRSEILGAYIFCENGQHYKMIRGQLLKPLDDFQKSAWYGAAKKYPGKNLIFASNLLKDAVGYDRTTLSYLKGISDPISGKFLGAIMYTMDIAKIRAIVAPYLSNQQSKIIITDESGRIIYHEDDKKINKLITNEFYMNSVLSGQEGFYQYNSGNGNMVGLFYTTSKLNRWRTVELLSLNLFLEPINRLRFYTGSLLLMSVLLLIYVTVVLSYQITRPIRDLTHAVSLFGDDLEFSADIRSKDEIGRLSRSFNKMAERIKLLINNVYSAQLKQKEAELSALQSKINPHFIYNTLEMIGNMADEHSISNISKASRNLGKILHYSLRFENELATVREELQYVRCYLSIQQIRFNNRFEVIFDVTPEALDFQILKLIIQPLVENSVSHGLEPKIGRGVLIISGERTKTALTIRIIDNGIGIPPETLQIINTSLKTGVNGFEQEEGGNRGFALMNVHSRLQLRYGKDSGLKIESTENKGTTVTLHIATEN